MLDTSCQDMSVLALSLFAYGTNTTRQAARKDGRLFIYIHILLLRSSEFIIGNYYFTLVPKQLCNCQGNWKNLSVETMFHSMQNTARTVNILCKNERSSIILSRESPNVYINCRVLTIKSVLSRHKSIINVTYQ